MKKLKFETLAIKSTENHFSDTKPVSNPIYLSSTYIRNDDGTYNNDFKYSRAGNPNRSTMEKSIALLEHGEICFAFSSGMAAVSAVFQSLKTGDHVIIPDDVYFNVFLVLRDVFSRWNLEFTQVDMSDESSIRGAVKDNTTLIWIESPSNPQLKVTDFESIVSIAKEKNMIVVADNTWPSPVLLNPIDFGVDLVVHSTTKYFGGHSDLIGGCVVLKENNAMAERIKEIQWFNGAVPSPFDCWLVGRGIQTMHVRVMAQTKSAHKLAEFLEQNPKIEKVNYPGLKSHEQYEIAAKYFSKGFGAMLSIIVKGSFDEIKSIPAKLNLFTTATSLGGVESLVEHRRLVEGEGSKTPDNLLRISVGLENVEDLIEDWRQALDF